MSELRVTNALHLNQKGYAALEKSASALRQRRLVEIKLEFADLMTALCVGGQARGVAPLFCKTGDRLACAVL